VLSGPDPLELSQVADEQASLRRVATLVARQAAPAEVFAAVAREAAHVLEVPLTSLVCFAPERTAIQVGVWGPQNPFPVGTRWELDEESVSGAVWRTGRPARVDDYGAVPGEISQRLGTLEIRSSVGAPILVEGRVWGVLMALASADAPLPEGTEARLAGFTELVATAISNAQARDDLRRLVEEQAALRRVATLVARGAQPTEIFDGVCAETGTLIGATSANLVHFTPDGLNLTLAGWSLRNTHVPTGTRLPLGEGTINRLIQSTGAPGRVDDYSAAPGELAALIRGRGIRSEVGAPVIVEGQVWGALIVGTDEADPLAAETELRVASFAELVATALANATARSELVASRARIVAAGDEARRRIERDLHDGAQQRLVGLALELRALESAVPDDLNEVRSELARLGDEVAAALDEVREISRGLHPALLSHAGLGPALGSLASRSAVPVELEVGVEGRLPRSVEIATYYAVSEALTNVARHSGASFARVRVESVGGWLHASVRDDGVGGADSGAGSGLAGLRDRVEALGGRFTIASAGNEGTSVSIELPLTGPAPSPASGAA
jgi:signal transduction histidine kinase